MTAPSVGTCLWFEDQAEEAATFYCSLFEDARITVVNRQHDADGPTDKALLVQFELHGQRYSALNGGPQFPLSPAVSIFVQVDSQAEIDRLWAALLSGGGTESRCGWLTDRFGLSWQIIPRALPRLLSDSDAATAGRVLQAMMPMVKIDIAALEAAARG